MIETSPAAPSAALLPLTGVRVIEVASYVAAPLAGLLLSQLGAEVIRVDPLGGAPDTRRWPLAPGGASLYWNGLNQGKRSVTVDLSSERGRDLVAQLVAAERLGGGILLTNADRPGLDAATLRHLRADLIHVRLEGMPNGISAVDYTVNAGLGYAHITGPEGSADPVNHVFPAWDVIAGHQLAMTVLAALLRRSATGEGTVATIALWDVALSAAAHLGALSEAELGGTARARDGNHVYGSFGHDFTTRDGGRVMVVALTRGHWDRLVDLCGVGPAVAGLEAALRVDFGLDADRYRHRELLVSLLKGWFSAHDVTEVEHALTAWGILHSRFRSFSDLARDLSTGELSTDLLTEVDQPGVGRVRVAGAVARSQEAGRVSGAPAPLLGDDTDAVLTEVLGLGTVHVAALRDDGAVG